MTCNHCCFSCTSKGQDMTQETFNNAIVFMKQYDETLTIGGGEPTLHPLFKEFLFKTIWEFAGTSDELDMPAVNLVTNGSNTEIALTLAKLAKRGVIGCSVSNDQYHDPIDERVYKAFKVEKNKYNSNPRDDFDCRGTNNGQGYIIPVGRAKGWGNHPFNKCACDAVFIKPNGDIYPCGCRKTKLANVNDKNIPFISTDFFQGYCNKSKECKELISVYFNLTPA